MPATGNCCKCVCVLCGSEWQLSCDCCLNAVLVETVVRHSVFHVFWIQKAGPNKLLWFFFLFLESLL